MSEVAARKILGPAAHTLKVLRPLGAYAGCGALRVLRARVTDAGIELTCGYERYIKVGL